MIGQIIQEVGPSESEISVFLIEFNCHVQGSILVIYQVMLVEPVFLAA